MTSNKLFSLALSLFGFAFIIAINEAAAGKGPVHGHHSPHHKHHHHGGGGGNGEGKGEGTGNEGGKESGGGNGDINVNGGGSLKEAGNGGQNVNGGGSLNGSPSVPDSVLEKAVGKLSSAEFGHILKEGLSPGAVRTVLSAINLKLAGDVIDYIPKSEVANVFKNAVSADTLKRLIEQESNAPFPGNIESTSASKIPSIIASLSKSKIAQIVKGFPRSIPPHFFANLPDKVVADVVKDFPESLQLMALRALPKSKIEEIIEGPESISGTPGQQGGLPAGEVGNSGSQGGSPGSKVGPPGSIGGPPSSKGGSLGNVPDDLSLGDIEKAVGKLSSAEFGHILKQELSPGSVANVLAGISPKLAGDLITYVPKSDILAVFETISADTLKKLIEQESNPDLGSAGNIESISASQIPQIYAGLPNSTIGRIAAGFPNSVKAHLFANLPDKTVGEVAKHLPESIQVKAVEALSKSKIEELAGGKPVADGSGGGELPGGNLNGNVEVHDGDYSHPGPDTKGVIGDRANPAGNESKGKGGGGLLGGLLNGIL